MTFPEKVKFVRIRRQLSQRELAQEIGISEVSLGRWERGDVEPRLVPLGKFYAYCERCGITFDEGATPC